MHYITLPLLDILESNALHYITFQMYITFHL